MKKRLEMFSDKPKRDKKSVDTHQQVKWFWQIDTLKQWVRDWHFKPEVLDQFPVVKKKFVFLLNRFCNVQWPFQPVTR